MKKTIKAILVKVKSLWKSFYRECDDLVQCFGFIAGMVFLFSIVKTDVPTDAVTYHCDYEEVVAMIKGASTDTVILHCDDGKVVTMIKKVNKKEERVESTPNTVDDTSKKTVDTNKNCKNCSKLWLFGIAPDILFCSCILGCRRLSKTKNIKKDTE